MSVAYDLAPCASEDAGPRTYRVREIVVIDGWSARIGLDYVCVHSDDDRLVLYLSTPREAHPRTVRASHGCYDAPLGDYAIEDVPALVEVATRGAPDEMRALLGVPS